MKWLMHCDEQFEQDVTYSRGLEAFLLILLGILFLAHLTVVGYQIRVTKLPFQAMTYTFSTLVLVHAFYMLGWRRALAFFGLTLGISFLAEFIGVKTGWVFGAYYYTDVLDPKLLSTVPVVIPLAYFMVIYPSYMMANLITRGRPTGQHLTAPWIVYVSALTAMIMTAWDLVMDPVMIYDVKAWVWVHGGPYFGVPFQNFSGWLLTTLLVSLVYRFVEMRLPMKPLGRGHRTFILLPLLGYAALCVGDLFVGIPMGTRMIAPFAMGIPLAAALIRLFGPRC